MIDNIKFQNICYINRNRKKYNAVKLVVILLFVILMILYFTEYEKQYKTYGQVVFNEKYYIKLNILKEDVEKITKNNQLLINDKKYKYTVHNISEELLIDTNYMNYKEITILLDNKQNYIINEILNINIVLGEEKTLKVIINYLFRKE